MKRILVVIVLVACVAAVGWWYLVPRETPIEPQTESKTTEYFLFSDDDAHTTKAVSVGSVVIIQLSKKAYSGVVFVKDQSGKSIEVKSEEIDDSIVISLDIKTPEKITVTVPKAAAAEDFSLIIDSTVAPINV
ncbi:MAG: hypothetical protein K0S38_208 [Candidatus Paceibacter sp.]|jgi:hypothetical protein|nr:hypothetical protein [Candidatus Paceibacter sp.]